MTASRPAISASARLDPATKAKQSSPHLETNGSPAKNTMPGDSDRVREGLKGLRMSRGVGLKRAENWHGVGRDGRALCWRVLCWGVLFVTSNGALLTVVVIYRHEPGFLRVDM